MANTAKRPPGDLELTGEYLTAMETISAHLMSCLPGNDELWRMLGETETLLLEAQITGTPVSKLFGKGGVAGFCQSIIDEKSSASSMNIPSEGRARKKTASKKQRHTANSHIRRKKNMVTGCIIGVWVLLIAFLIGQYTGFVDYLFHPQTFYLEELHNFEAQVTPLENSGTQVSFSLSSGSLSPQSLYTQGDHRVTLTQIGYDEIQTDEQVICKWWVELIYTQSTSFFEITYVAPTGTGTAKVTLPGQDEVTQSLAWQGEDRYDDGTAYIRLCFLEVPKGTSVEGGTVELCFDDLKQVCWHRTGVGRRAK